MHEAREGEPQMSDQVKFVLPESELPKAWYNIQADLPFELPAVLHPGTKQPVTPDDFAPLFPMEIIKQEATKERWVEIPEPVRQVYRQWRPTRAPPGAPAGTGTSDPGPYLLQVRGRQPGRQPQAQHRGRPGLLQQRGRHQAHDHRNRRRPMGQRAGLRLRALRNGPAGVHGARQLRPEALPAPPDGNLGRQRCRVAQHRNQRGPHHPGRESRHAPAAWASPSARPSKTPSPTRCPPSTASAPC